MKKKRNQKNNLKKPKLNQKESESESFSEESDNKDSENIDQNEDLENTDCNKKEVVGPVSCSQGSERFEKIEKSNSQDKCSEVEEYEDNRVIDSTESDNIEINFSNDNQDTENNK